jgi:PAS domain S-box-containing protein
MLKPLNLLLVEDSEDDAQLILFELRRLGYEAEIERVETAESMRSALKEKTWDLIISDYSMPAFNAPKALDVLDASGLDLPFIIISGTIGEEHAVEALKAGANDFLVKGKFARLGPAIERELREAETRRERKKAEDMRAADERRFRALIENAPDGITVVDAKGIVTYVSPSVEHILGYSQVEALGQAAIKYVHPKDRSRLLRQLAQPTREQSRALVQYRFRHKDGSWRWLESTSSNLIADSGAEAIVFNYRDVTERKQAEETIQQYANELERRVEERTLELTRANRAKDEFMATMTHELRTPLNSILGLSESLLEQRRDPLSEYQQRSLKIIESSGQHLLELINDVLDLSKVEAGMLEYYPQVVDVNALCRSSLVMIKEQAAGKSIRLVHEEDQSGLKIYADPRRLKQILVNLLTNAVKFTPDHGRVTLEVHADIEDDRVQFDVIDTGIGIAEEDLKKLFQPFVQIDSSLNRRFDGTGLGLALIQKLTDLHGGSIRVESKVDMGSRFTVNIPWDRTIVVQQEAIHFGNKPVINERSQKSEKTSEESSGRGLILLAEDNEANTLTVGEYLDSHGYKMVYAHDGMEAVDKAEETDPDIILMDIQMPVMDGLEAIRRLRVDTRFDSTPIIALTALAMPGDRERCLDAGANEYMSKPVSLKKLSATISKMLKKNE